MANRFIGGILSSKPRSNSSFIGRASTGTYFDKNGVLQTAPVNQPRLNYTYVNGGWTSPSVLIEPESTNIQLYSRQVGTGNWAGGEYATVGANATTAPDGTTTATQFTPTAVNNFHRMTFGQNFNSTNGVYTTSLFLKANGYTYVTLRFDDGSGTIIGTAFNLTGNGSSSTGYYDNNGVCSAPLSNSITPVGNGWYRVSVTVRVVNYSNVGLYYYVMSNATTSYFTGDGTSGIFAWGGQVERGYTMTSFIPTTTSFVTRATDVTSSTPSGIYSLEDQQSQSSLDDQYKIESFTTVGSTTWTAPADVRQVEVLVVAGGGGGGGAGNTGGGSGGGAGGLIYNPAYPVTPGQSYTVTVGAGGAGGISLASAATGNQSQFGSLIAAGGGGGVYAEVNWPNATNGKSGGSGSGGGRVSSGSYPLAGQSVTGQGNAGGAGGIGGGSGGGGGAGTQGSNAGRAYGTIADFGGKGGDGLQFNITGTATWYAGGGGGGAYTGASAGTGGLGGGGSGATGANNGSNGLANTGGGGGGAGGRSSGTGNGGNGGSGIVVIKYKKTNTQLVNTQNSAIVVQKFITSNTWTAPAGVKEVEVLVVGGGGSGASGNGDRGGGGAGGVVYNSAYAVVPGQAYTVTVGAGGQYPATPGQGTAGGSSVFGTITALGGGGGGDFGATGSAGASGGGGGGGDTGGSPFPGAGGSATQPSSASGGYGNAGGTGGTGTTNQGSRNLGGGGGGAGSVGKEGVSTKGGDGGNGLPFVVTGSLEYYAGGGAGGSNSGQGGNGGIGGGGKGSTSNSNGYSGAANTGGGGGGGALGGSGGSGVVILRYRVPYVAVFQDSGTWTCPAGVTSVQALVVAGGGSGSGSRGNINGSPGGGAGGLIYSSSVPVKPGNTYSIIVGKGAVQSISAADGTRGENSSFAGLVAVGGGGGNGNTSYNEYQFNGGSGGGDAEGRYNAGRAVGIYGQGNAGGDTVSGVGGVYAGAGGGGAGTAGGNITGLNGSNGGNGLQFSISGTPTWYAGGGGGSMAQGGLTYGSGGLGGGGNSTAGVQSTRHGTPNTGGGGGGAFNNVSTDAYGGNGGSGIVIIRWNSN